MYTRHDEIPILYHRNGSVPAPYYNHVQSALRRFGPSLRLRIPKLKTLDLVVQRDAWIVVDRAFNDIPVAAWCEFEASGRDNLHEPVRCRIRLFHGHAGMILKRVLDAMETLLGERLLEGQGAEGRRVVPFRPRDGE